MNLLILATSLLPVLACATSPASEPATTQTEYDATAENLGASTASLHGDGELAAMVNIIAIAHGAAPTGFVELQLSCNDGEGTLLPQCGPRTQLVDVDFTTTTGRRGTWSLMNVQSSMVKFAGTGDAEAFVSITSAITNVTANYHFDYTATYPAVFIDMASHLAAAGSISYAVTATKDIGGHGDRTFDIAATVHFNGDATATIELDGTHDYTLDLTTGVVVAGVPIS
jgi:hypothetical protein